MAWTTPGTATAGEVLTAAFWNENVRDNSLELAPFFVPWTSYTPTLAQGVTNNIAKTVNQARYMKIGNTLFVNIYLVATGTGTANNAVTVSIPSGFTMAVNQFYLTGQGNFSDVSVTSYPVQPLYTTNTTVGFRRSDTTGVSQSIGSDPNIAVASGDAIFVSFVVEVTP